MLPSPPRSGRRHQAFCVICTANCTNVTPSPGRRSTCEAAKVNTHAQTKTRHPHGAGSTRAYGGPRIFVYRKFGAHTVCVCVPPFEMERGNGASNRLSPKRYPKKKKNWNHYNNTPNNRIQRDPIEIAAACVQSAGGKGDKDA